LRDAFVLVDQAAKHRSTLDPRTSEVCDRMARPGWAKLAGPVRPRSVVVLGVLHEHGPQMPFAKNTMRSVSSDLAVSTNLLEGV
jgi:hypothetical protein